MSVFEQLPQRQDGTKVLPWDKEWTNDVSWGIYDSQWGRVNMEPGREAVIDVPEAIKTGDIVDPGMVLQFVKGGYRELFARIYGH